MDKETLSNYGWIVVLVLILAIMLALASPFGMFVSDAIKNTTQGLFDVNSSALNTVGINPDDLSFNGSSNITYYTIEEIEADEHLYAIGKTKPEYVVATFNDDYTEVIITKNGDDSDGYIKDSAFYEHYNKPLFPDLKTVIIKEGILNIGQSSFRMSSNLSKIVFPNSLTVIDEYAFLGTAISDLTIGQEVTEIKDFAFNNCSRLKTLHIKSNVKTIGREAFKSCKNLSKVIIDDGLQNIEYEGFAFCRNLTQINLPNTITHIDNNAFSDCYALEKIEIPNSLSLISNAMFARCDMLTDIKLPNTITKIDDFGFFFCESLENIELPTSIEIIGSTSFRNCIKLKEIKIPPLVKQIKEHTFRYCYELNTIYLHKNITQIDEGAFFNIDANATIYCETEEVKNLLIKDVNYNQETIHIIVDTGKF